MTRLQMEAVINAGGQVLWLGNRLTTIGELPTQDEIDLVYAESRGPSAYEVAVNNGFVGTELEWLDSLVGPDGALGPEGLSAYQVAVDNGFVGDEAAWLDSLVGPQGPQGDPGLDGTGSGNMNGPASSVDSNIPLFDGTTGELLKDSGVALSNLATTSALTSGLAGKENSLGFTAVPNTRTVNGHALSVDVTVSKSDVGLGNVDNTSNATERAAVATLTNKTLTSPVINTPTGIVKGDVGLGNVDNTSDASKATTERAAVATLTNKTLTSPVINTPTGIVKGDVGLGNVDNTSNATERAATATLTNKTLTSPVINTPTGIVKGDVGLGNVDNTSNATERAATATLTNKTIAGGSNTISGITEAMQTTADNTTADVSTTKHGYAPKAPNDTTKFLRGDATWAVPAGGGASVVELGMGNLGGAGTTYMSSEGGNGTEAVATFVIPFTGTLSNLYVYRASGAGGSGTSTFTVRQNGSDTTLTCQSGNSGSAGTVISDTTHTVSVTAGDKIVCKFVSSSSAGGINRATCKIA